MCTFALKQRGIVLSFQGVHVYICTQTNGDGVVLPVCSTAFHRSNGLVLHLYGLLLLDGILTCRRVHHDATIHALSFDSPLSLLGALLFKGVLSPMRYRVFLSPCPKVYVVSRVFFFAVSACPGKKWPPRVLLFCFQRVQFSPLKSKGLCSHFSETWANSEFFPRLSTGTP